MYCIDPGCGDITNGKEHWLLGAGYMYLIPGFTLCNLHCPGGMGQYFIHFFEGAANSISLFHNHRTIFKTPTNDMDIAGFERLLEINPHRKINRSDKPMVHEKTLIIKSMKNRTTLRPVYRNTGHTAAAGSAVYRPATGQSGCNQRHTR
ncbi:hypothetical protein HNQ91_003416 [Filimonas zeae]|uniref:Uncharacterized protein n=1 Tax=Filimonas zeae TaxID=1737353 RepID=A0A917MYU8_9BACT|nr:hypothetical protein [Filimonas zeae]MDR6340351.1 hypothetical protein [Filimonas zeae]GGH72330.1 hypothetical protein GCM10011379_32630 [Filimonas zeae]